MLGCGRGPCPLCQPLCSAWSFQTPPPQHQHIHEHIQKRRESLCTHHQHQQLLTSAKLISSASPSTLPPQTILKATPDITPNCFRMFL